MTKTSEIIKGSTKGLVGIVSCLFTVGLAADLNQGLYNSIKTTSGRAGYLVSEAFVTLGVAGATAYYLFAN